MRMTKKVSRKAAKTSVESYFLAALRETLFAESQSSKTASSFAAEKYARERKRSNVSSTGDTPIKPSARGKRSQSERRQDF